MEKLDAIKKSLTNALHQFEKSIKRINTKKYEEIYDSLRDSCVKRFEFSIDTFWKYIKTFLIEVKGIDGEILTSPRSTFRAAQQALVISKEEMDRLMAMYEDRNRTSHTYEEEIAESIMDNIPSYLATMKAILKNLDQQMQKPD